MTNSVIDKIKKAAASNSLTITSMDSRVNAKTAEKAAREIDFAQNWNIAYQMDGGK